MGHGKQLESSMERKTKWRNEVMVGEKVMHSSLHMTDWNTHQRDKSWKWDIQSQSSREREMLARERMTKDHPCGCGLSRVYYQKREQSPGQNTGDFRERGDWDWNQRVAKDVKERKLECGFLRPRGVIAKGRMEDSLGSNDGQRHSEVRTKE